MKKKEKEFNLENKKQNKTNKKKKTLTFEDDIILYIENL